MGMLDAREIPTFLQYIDSHRVRSWVVGIRNSSAPVLTLGVSLRRQRSRCASAIARMAAWVVHSPTMGWIPLP